MVEQKGFKSSVIDVPRQPNQEDLFGIQVYQEALIEYIKYTGTPITIALQGEWGSGKTSLMNSLRFSLCDVAPAPYFGVWINTWQFALLHSPSQAVISILESIINQIGSLNPNQQRWEASKKAIGDIFKRMAVVGTKVATQAVGINGECIEGLFGGNDKASESDSNVEKLKQEIVALINDAMSQSRDKKGFIFFIDDLDRIDPSLAVEILELLKNLFDLDHCVFVLAIDYNVVIKGLRPKFGELTAQNEREFRSFFDKIIQLPFSMPVASYAIDNFLVKALQDIAFFNAEELKNQGLVSDLSEIAQWTVGTNPRSLKRLTNTLSLISIINRIQSQKAQAQGLVENQPAELDTFTKQLSYALVCIQIAYPAIYNLLLDEPDFKGWDIALATRLKAPLIDEAILESLKESEAFDEEWEQTLFRICQQDAYLQQHSFDLSQLLNKIAHMVNNDEELGEIVSQVMDLSTVTNIKAGSTNEAASANNAQKRKYVKDTSVYVFRGQRFDARSKKFDVIHQVFCEYIADHPELTAQEMVETMTIWPNAKSYFQLRDAATVDENDPKVAKEYRFDFPPLKEGRVCLPRYMYFKKEFDKHLELFDKLGYHIEVVQE